MNLLVYIVFLWIVVFHQSSCLIRIDLPFTVKSNVYKPGSDSKKVTNTVHATIRKTIPPNDIRRYYMAAKQDVRRPKFDLIPSSNIRSHVDFEDEKDDNLKIKISTLVQQTIHDTERKIKSIQHVKDENRETAPYKAGFLLSMIKKSRDVLNELFNVAVKHKDEWKALEQLKIFELIVHTNVDTTNLVRHLVEIHIQHLNATHPVDTQGRKRVVLL